MKSSITHAEYLQLQGLKAMAQQHVEAITRVAVAARQIVGEPSREKYDCGHVDDLMWSDNEAVDNTLRKMGITVDPPLPAPPPTVADYTFQEEERTAAIAVVQAARQAGWPEAEKLADLERSLAEQKGDGQ